MRSGRGTRRVVKIATPLALVFVSICTATTARTQDLRTDEDAETEQVVGGATRTNVGLLKEPPALTRAIDTGFVRFGETGTPANGPYVELSNMITGSGWVSIGPGYRHDVLDRNAFVDVSAAVSWHAYNMMQGRFEFPRLADSHLSIGSQVMWEDETQISYFGTGPGSLPQNESQYRMQTLDTVGYATLRPVPSLALTGEIGFLRRPDVLSPGGTFRPLVPSTQDEFPNDPGVASPFQPNYAHSQISLTSDTRDHRSRPTEGGLYRAALTTFVDQSTSTGAFSFRQYEAEGTQFAPIDDDSNWVVVAHGWIVWSDVPAGHEVPFYLLPSLGGNNTLRSYPDYRFHDSNLVVINGESRWTLFTHMDAAVFIDAGNVAPRVQNLNFNKVSIGGGVRFHTDRVTFARVDFAYGAEGWKLVFRTSDVFRFSRMTRRVAAVPFVP